MTAPAEQLRAAAAKLRDTAAKAECWDAREVHDGECTDWEKYYGHSPEADLPEGDGPWIVLMSPVVAEPLAALLEEVADGWMVGSVQVLDLARAILGEAP